MSMHASAEFQWTEEELAKLKKEHGFYLRGLEVTRLDTFIDAAFAFVLTLLVISFDAIPSSWPELVEAFKRIPAFFGAFIVLMMSWMNHRRWSRRYGLEDRVSVVASLGIIFVIMVYVYPLRIVFDQMFNFLSDGFFVSTFVIDSWEGLRGMFILYSAGYIVVSILFGILYFQAGRSAAKLGLSAYELYETNYEVASSVLGVFVALISISIASLAEGLWITYAGWIYGILFILEPLMKRFYFTVEDSAPVEDSPSVEDAAPVEDSAPASD